MRNKTLLGLIAAVTALMLLGAACGGTNDSGDQTGSATDEGDTGSSMTEEETPAPEAVDSDASGLNGTLTHGLTEHEYLAGIAITMGVQKGLDSPEFAAAAEALDENSVALSEAISSIYGEAGGEQFLDLWRKHIGFFVDYTKAQATGDKAGAAKAKENLDGYRSDFGAFLESATEGSLPKDAVAGALTPHVESTITAIDAVLGKKDGNPFSLLKEAAGHLPGIATALAAGIDTQQDLDGAPDSGPSQLNGTLTYALTEHEYLAGIAVTMGVQKGLDSPEFEAAAAALDENSVDLSEAIASLYGEAGGEQFLDLWRKHIGFFVDYTKAQATGDKAGAAKAKENLDGYRSDFGAFLESATEGGLPKDAVADALTPHVDSTIKAIDTVLGQEKGNPFSALREAAGHLPGIATVLAGAFVEQFPDKFV